VPRIARGIADSFVYHVLNRGNGKQTVFHKDQDYQAFFDLLKEAKARYPIKIFAYCLMPNHFHLVLMPTQGKDLSRYMQWLMTSHVRRYHRHYGTSGHVWQGRFKSFIIQEDAHLLTLIRYVEGNPVRASLVKSAREWPWSSHQASADEKAIKLLDEIPVELPYAWSKFVDDPLTENELQRLRESVNRQAPFGARTWQSNICKKLGLESSIRHRGRPKKT
jgi:putative transposase